MKPDREAAVAIIERSGGGQLRPALFVFMDPQGFSWVEPGYRETSPSRSCLHRVRGTLTMRPDGFICESQDGRTYLVTEVGGIEGEAGDQLRAAIAWARGDIEGDGSDLDTERAQVRERIGPSQA